MSLLFNILFKILFLLLFVYSMVYIFYIETEKYESKSIIMIKDLSQEQSASPLGSLLLPSGSESTTDARLLEIYIKSVDMFNVLDHDFNLSEYYKSDELDVLNRLSVNTLLPNYWVNKENILMSYNKDLLIVYDEPSATISIGFAHASAELSKQIVNSIIVQSTKVLNRFENENTKVVLTFLKKQEKLKHELFIASLEELLDYQNKTSSIDPQVDIAVKNKILAELESELIQKNVEYNSKAQYLNLNSAEMQLFKGNISYIKKSIRKIKDKITGKNGHKKLNVDISDFMLLKSKVEFNKELYIQTLVKLEETKVLVSQNTKNLIVISKAELPDSYAYPNKFRDSFSVLLILAFIYGIISLISTIIRDHKD